MPWAFRSTIPFTTFSWTGLTYTRGFSCAFTPLTSNDNSTNTQTTSSSRLTILPVDIRRRKCFLRQENGINKLYRQGSCSECWCQKGCWSEVFPKRLSISRVYNKQFQQRKYVVGFWGQRSEWVWKQEYLKQALLNSTSGQTCPTLSHITTATLIATR